MPFLKQQPCSSNNLLSESFGMEACPDEAECFNVSYSSWNGVCVELRYTSWNDFKKSGFYAAQTHHNTIFDGLKGITLSSAPYITGFSHIIHLPGCSWKIESHTLEEMQQAIQSLLCKNQEAANTSNPLPGDQRTLLQQLDRKIRYASLLDYRSQGIQPCDIHLALRSALKHRTDIFIPDVDAVSANGNGLSVDALITHGYKHIAFVYRLQPGHLVAVWGDLDASGSSIYYMDPMREEGKEDLGLLLPLGNLLHLNQNSQALPNIHLEQCVSIRGLTGAHAFATLISMAGVRSPLFNSDILDLKKITYLLYQHKFAEEKWQEAAITDSSQAPSLQQIQHYKRAAADSLQIAKSKCRELIHHLLQALDFTQKESIALLENNPGTQFHALFLEHLDQNAFCLLSKEDRYAFIRFLLALRFPLDEKTVKQLTNSDLQANCSLFLLFFIEEWSRSLQACQNCKSVCGPTKRSAVQSRHVGVGKQYSVFPGR